MYLNPQIHDTQDTLTIHVRYMSDTCRIHQDTYLEPYLRPRADARLGDALGASLAGLGALAGALGATAATARVQDTRILMHPDMYPV